MIKSVTVGLCALAFTTSLAFAQTMTPAPTAGMSTHTDPMNANAKMMKKKKMKKGMMKSGDDMSGMKKDDMGGMKKDGMSK